MRESYVPPVTRVREPKPEWVAVWRFRAVALVLLIAIGALTAWGVNLLLHASDQDPTSDPIPTTGPQSPGP